MTTSPDVPTVGMGAALRRPLDEMPDPAHNLLRRQPRRCRGSRRHPTESLLKL